MVTSIGTLEDVASAVAIQHDGKIVAAGFSRTAANSDVAVARYDHTGILDPAFSGDGKLTLGIGSGNDEAAPSRSGPDGKILVAGYAGRRATCPSPV